MFISSSVVITTGKRVKFLHMSSLEWKLQKKSAAVVDDADDVNHIKPSESQTFKTHSKKYKS